MSLVTSRLARSASLSTLSALKKESPGKYQRSLSGKITKSVSDSSIETIKKSNSCDSISPPIKVDGCEYKKVMIIAGATAELANPLILRSIEAGYSVIGLTTQENPSPKKGVETSQFRYLKVSAADYHSPKGLEGALAGIFEGEQPDEIAGIVLIGGATAPRGTTLEMLNVLPLQTFSTALSSVSRGVKKTGLIYLSSVAATHLADHGSPYAVARKQADDWLIHESKQDTAVSFRPGLLIDNPRVTKTLASKHAYSMDQLVNTPFVTPVIGSGNQICESVIIDDLIDAMLNSLASPVEIRDTIHAVTRHQYTQLGLLQLYGAAAGREIRPFHIPAGMARIIANHFPYGRLASYSAHMFEVRDTPSAELLCHRRFEEILGREPSSLEALFHLNDSEPFLTSKSPVFEHAKHIITTSLSEQEARAALAEIIIKFGPTMAYELLKSLTR